MSRYEILQDFFGSWAAINRSTFAKEVGINRNTLNLIFQEQRNPSDEIWPRLAMGMAKYGYPTGRLKGEKLAIATVGGYRPVEERLKSHRTAKLRYEFHKVPVWKPDQMIKLQRPAIIGWNEKPPADEKQLLQTLLEQLEMDIAEGYEPDMLITTDLKEGADFEGKVVYLKPK